MVILSCVLLVKPVMPLLEYAINQEYIAEVLCINRDRPDKGCNGKCYLMSQLEKEVGKDTPAQKGSSRIEIEVIVAFLQQPFRFSAHVAFRIIEPFFCESYRFDYKFLNQSRIDSPPWKSLA